MKKLTHSANNNAATPKSRFGSALAMCALSFLTFPSSNLIAAISCPDGQYDNSSGGCSMSSGYTPTDQGSVAQAHLNSYYQNKAKFSDYQKEWERWNVKNLGLIDRLNTPLLRQYQLLTVRLAKWHREDVESFVDYFKGIKTTIPIDLATDLPNDMTTKARRHTMLGFVLDAYVAKRDSYLLGQYNANLKNIAHLYFQMNPTIMKSISINYWIKAYAPSVSGKTGFTSAYSDAMSLRDVQTFYPFIKVAGSDDYDFRQVEETFSDKWNNASTSPSTNTVKTIKYYKFVPFPLPDAFIPSIAEKMDQKLIDEVNSETLAHTQAEVVGFNFNALKGSYLTANKNKDELLRKSVNLALAFPEVEDLTQISRVVNKAKRTCLAPNESRVRPGQIDLEHGVDTKKCNSGSRALDWYVIENQDKTIQLKNAFSGQCLTAPRSGTDAPLTLVCGGRTNTYKPASQYWEWTDDNRLRHLYSLTVMEPTAHPSAWSTGGTLEIFPYDYLQGKEVNRAKWLINTGYLKNDIYNPKNYETPDYLTKNFFALMYGFTEELPLMDRIKTVNAGKNLPTRDLTGNNLTDVYTSQARASAFFSKIYSDSGLYNQLPASIQRFITSLRSGTPLIEAYGQNALAIYDDVRRTYAFKPTYWNDATNKPGSIHTYNNLKSDSVDVFISTFNGNPATSNKPFPTTRQSNANWTYVASLGSSAQVRKTVRAMSNYFAEAGDPANYGDIFKNLNLTSRKMEFFQANFKGATDERSFDFPTHQTSNAKWRYLGQAGDATVLIAALSNDIAKAYTSYMYSLVNVNIGNKQRIPAIDLALHQETGNGEDGFEFDNWTHTDSSAPNLAYGIEARAGQYIQVSSPTLSGVSLYTANNLGSLGAITNALINVKSDWVISDKSQLQLERALLRNKFDEMLNKRFTEILRELEPDEEVVPADSFDFPDPSPRAVFDDWSEGRFDPPEDFQKLRTELRSLFREGPAGDIEMRDFIESMRDDAPPIEAAGEALLTLDNTSLSTAFDALTLTESSIALSTVGISAVMPTIVGFIF